MSDAETWHRHACRVCTQGLEFWPEATRLSDFSCILVSVETHSNVSVLIDLIKFEVLDGFTLWELPFFLFHVSYEAYEIIHLRSLWVEGCEAADHYAQSVMHKSWFIILPASGSGALWHLQWWRAHFFWRTPVKFVKNIFSIYVFLHLMSLGTLFCRINFLHTFFS